MRHREANARCSRSPDPHRPLGGAGRGGGVEVDMGERMGKGKLLESKSSCVPYN